MIRKEGNRTIVIFGRGSVSVCTAQSCYGDKNIVVLSQVEAGDIGDIIEEDKGKPTGSLDQPIELVFEKVDSIDIVIEKLMEIRKELLNDPDLIKEETR